MRIDAMEVRILANPTNSLSKKIRGLFIHRDDAYGMQKSDGRYVSVRAPLDDRILAGHLSHRHTIGAYQLKDDTVRWGCLDLDPDKFPDAQTAQAACRVLYAQFVKSWPHDAVWVEASRYPDPSFHIWIFFEFTPADVVKTLLDRVIELVKIDPTKVEVFPKQISITSDRPYGNFVKLPLGLHRKVRKRSRWLDPATLEPISDTAILRAETAIVTPKQIQQI